MRKRSEVASKSRSDSEPAHAPVSSEASIVPDANPQVLPGAGRKTVFGEPSNNPHPELQVLRGGEHRAGFSEASIVPDANPQALPGAGRKPVFGGPRLNAHANPQVLRGGRHRPKVSEASTKWPTWRASLDGTLKRLHDTEIKVRSFFDFSRLILFGRQSVVLKAAWTAAARRRLEMTVGSNTKAESSRRSPKCLGHFQSASAHHHYYYSSTGEPAASTFVSRTPRKLTPMFLGVALQIGFGVALLICFGVERVAAATHPKLDPNVDAAKCLECHADKAKGKVVHSAKTSGCLSCHEVRVNRDITRVKLITATPASLCYTCHKDKNPTTLTGRIHPPDARDCLKCHDPHKSDNPALLVKATSGDQTKNLCLTCHDVGVHISKGGSRHPALDSGCDTCHIIHKTGDPEKREYAYHLTKDAPALCTDCHDVKEAAIVKAHHSQPFETADCIQCHDARQSNSPKLMQAFLHNPFENKECDSCHQPAQNGKVVLTQKDVKSTCAVCHEEQAKQIASAKVPHPGAQDDCTVCHNPHGGMTPGFLQPNPVSACLACHPERSEDFKKKHLHQPASDLGCATCHEPHGGDNAHLLRKANVNELCLECHGPEANPEKAEGQHLVTIFDGKVKLPDNYFRKVPVLPLQYGFGHPVEHHPVSDVPDPKSKGVIKLSCLSCHQPHASANRALLVKDQEPNMAFCKTCHAEGTLLLR